MNSLIHKMSFKCNVKFTKKLFLKILIFLIGFGFLSLQLWQTFQTFIEKRSTFVISQKIFDTLIPPTIVLCLPFQKNIFLNKRFNITIKMSKPNIETESLTKTQINLTLGENYDEQEKLLELKEICKEHRRQKKKASYQSKKKQKNNKVNFSLFVMLNHF